MGASLSWLVCDEQHKEEMKKLLGASDCKPGVTPSLCVDVTLEGKLFVSEARGRQWQFDNELQRIRLSKGKEVYFGVYEEHVMYSEAALWKDGKEVWYMKHDSEQGIYHLDARGDLPESFEKIKKRTIKEQDEEGGEDAGVDYVIGIPTSVLADFTGCDCAEEEPDGEYSEWVCASKSGGIFSRLFGRKQ
tara:strand:+ start:70 stop:639 length:570 start_codon:yes stop_codon:yes gene_type:complete